MHSSRVNFTAAGLAVALCLCGLGAAVASPARSTVWIEVLREDGLRFKGHRLPRNGEGMGVVTPSREIATAAHVVWGARTIIVTDAQGSCLPATVAQIDERVDVAVLRVERPPDHFAAIRVKPAVAGERVGVVTRSPAGHAPAIASGVVGATRWTSYGVPVPLIFTGIKGEKGMSGGGLFDAAGALVGIIIRIDRPSGYLTALPIAEFCARLSRCAARTEPEKTPPASSAARVARDGRG
jgi:S1-C subfamily serine protease